MKKYKEYMDTIRASGSLHQRLAGLEEPGKRPIPWKRYGSLAAALVLVLGLGGYGYAHYQNMIKGPTGEAFLEHTQAFNPADAPDIAPEDPDQQCEPAEKILGSYEVQEERGGVSVVVGHFLPYIEYGEVNNLAVLDWDIPPGATRRDLSQEEIVALMGGEDAVDTHLDWGEYELSGWAAWYEDGSFWGAYIDGSRMVYGLGAADQFEFAVTADQLPPTCFAYPGSVTQEIAIWKLEVTADKSDWTTELENGRGLRHSERRVSFMKDGYGYRFEMTSGDPEQGEWMVSRLVRRIADQGLALWTVDKSQEGGYICSNCGKLVQAGTKHSHTYIGADSASTEPYDPNEAADPSDFAPAMSAPPIPVSDAPIMYTCGTCGKSVTAGGVHFRFISNGDGTFTCDSCSVTIPAGEMHYHTAYGAMCSGYPVPDPNDGCIGLPPPYTCPDCGEIYMSGTEHHCAGETDTCSICGGTYPAGTEHSHEVCGLPLAPSDTAIDTIID